MKRFGGSTVTCGLGSDAEYMPIISPPYVIPINTTSHNLIGHIHNLNQDQGSGLLKTDILHQ